MNEKELEREVLRLAKDSIITCREAMALAKKAGIPTRNMAGLLDRLKIRISGCQLGCF